MWVVVLVFFTAVIQVLHFLVANVSRCVLGPCKGRHRFFFSGFRSLSPREGGVEGAAPCRGRGALRQAGQQGGVTHRSQPGTRGGDIPWPGLGKGSLGTRDLPNERVGVF